MFDFLEPDDIVIIKRALSYFAQVYFEKGLYTDQNGCVTHHIVSLTLVHCVLESC